MSNDHSVVLPDEIVTHGQQDQTPHQRQPRLAYSVLSDQTANEWPVAPDKKSSTQRSQCVLRPRLRCDDNCTLLRLARVVQLVSLCEHEIPLSEAALVVNLAEKAIKTGCEWLPGPIAGELKFMVMPV